MTCLLLCQSSNYIFLSKPSFTSNWNKSRNWTGTWLRASQYICIWLGLTTNMCSINKSTKKMLKMVLCWHFIVYILPVANSDSHIDFKLILISRLNWDSLIMKNIFWIWDPTVASLRCGKFYYLKVQTGGDIDKENFYQIIWALPRQTTLGQIILFLWSLHIYGWIDVLNIQLNRTLILSIFIELIKTTF